MAQERGATEAEQSARVVGRIVYRSDRQVADWVAKNLGSQPWAGSFAALGVLDKNCKGLIAGVVYHSYDGVNVIMSIAATDPRWARKGILKTIFHYPFTSLGCRRVTALVHEDNTRSQRLVTGLGYKREGSLREAADDGGDMLVYGLLKSECRFHHG